MTEGRPPTDLLQEYLGVIDAFEAAVRACPDDRWDDSLWEVKTTDPWVWPKPGIEPLPHRTIESIQVYSACWQVSAHCAFFLDFYLSGPNLDGYRPPSPFEGQLDEKWEADGCPELPPRRFTKAEIIDYIAFGRAKAERILPELTEEDLATPIPPPHPWAGSTYRQLLDVNLRHVLEHGGQLAEHVDLR